MIKNFKLGKAILAGFFGTVAMTALMYGLPLVGLPRMDIMAALGSVFPFAVSPYVMGSLVHLATGISLGVMYALFFDSWLPGPGWVRGALFSLAPWLFAITLLGPSLMLASEILKGRDAAAANPCAVSNPCAAPSTNPCAVQPPNPCSAAPAQINPCAPKVSNPCAVSANPCAVSNPCAATANPCAVSNPCAAANPCGAGAGTSSSGPSPQTMSLIAHLLFGVVVGGIYRPSKAWA